MPLLCTPYALAMTGHCYVLSRRVLILHNKRMEDNWWPERAASTWENSPDCYMFHSLPGQGVFWVLTTC